MAKVQISLPLDIEVVEVLKVDLDGETIHIQVESTLNSARCEHCGRKIMTFHGYGDWVKVQHLPSFGRPVFVYYRPKRYECPYCDNHPTTRQQLRWHEPHSPHTKAYDEYLLLRKPTILLALHVLDVDCLKYSDDVSYIEVIRQYLQCIDL